VCPVSSIQLSRTRPSELLFSEFLFFIKAAPTGNRGIAQLYGVMSSLDEQVSGMEEPRLWLRFVGVLGHAPSLSTSQRAITRVKGADSATATGEDG
jgi:hypothetical protein